MRRACACAGYDRGGGALGRSPTTGCGELRPAGRLLSPELRDAAVYPALPGPWPAAIARSTLFEMCWQSLRG